MKLLKSKESIIYVLIILSVIVWLLQPLIALATTTDTHGSFEPVSVHTIALVADGTTAFYTPPQPPKLPQEASTSPIEQLVRAEFADKPRMIDVARCESGFTQFRGETVLMGGMNHHFVGIFQEHISWEAVAQKNGYSIYTTEGNIKMARYLLDTYGISQWECAK